MTDEQTMVEKVARAIAETYPFSGMNYDNCGSVTKSMYIDNARAAIEAMREPTDGMIKAAAETPGMKAVDTLATNYFARMGVDVLLSASKDGAPLLQAWRASIDAALAEPLT